MIIGIHQPYFLPYLGYFQLINAVDEFLLLDDVTFIKQGYINRNSILVGGKAQLISLQINGISSNKLIREHHLSENPIWKNKILKTVQQNYTKAPFFNDVYPIIKRCILHKNNNLSEYLKFQIEQICSYLNIKTEIISCSSLRSRNELKKQELVIDLCLKRSAKVYLNTLGGKNLYDKDVFKKNNLELKFIKKNNIKYNQFKNNFVDNLSIIDLLMFNSHYDISNLLKQCEIFK